MKNWLENVTAEVAEALREARLEAAKSSILINNGKIDWMIIELNKKYSTAEEKARALKAVSAESESTFK